MAGTKSEILRAIPRTSQPTTTLQLVQTWDWMGNAVQYDTIQYLLYISHYYTYNFPYITHNSQDVSTNNNSAVGWGGIGCVMPYTAYSTTPTMLYIQLTMHYM